MGKKEGVEWCFAVKVRIYENATGREGTDLCYVDSENLIRRICYGLQIRTTCSMEAKVALTCSPRWLPGLRCLITIDSHDNILSRSLLTH